MITVKLDQVADFLEWINKTYMKSGPEIELYFGTDTSAVNPNDPPISVVQSSENQNQQILIGMDVSHIDTIPAIIESVAHILGGDGNEDVFITRIRNDWNSYCYAQVQASAGNLILTRFYDSEDSDTVLEN